MSDDAKCKILVGIAIGVDVERANGFVTLVNANPERNEATEKRVNGLRQRFVSTTNTRKRLLKRKLLRAIDAHNSLEATLDASLGIANNFFDLVTLKCLPIDEAGFMGNGGEIYVFDMGESVKVMDVALNLIRLSGLEPYKDIQIKYIGLRPGEKLYEELFSADEPMISTHNIKINIAQVADNDSSLIKKEVDIILNSLSQMSDSRLIEELHRIVPGYSCKFELIDQKQ